MVFREKVMGNKNNKLEDYLALPAEILNLIPGNFCWKNKEGLYLGCNQSVAEVLSLNTTSDFLGHPLEDVMPKACALPMLENDHYVMSNDREMVFEEVYFNAKGEASVYLSQKTPLHDEEGKVIGLINLAINITQGVNIKEICSPLLQGIEQGVVKSDISTLPSHLLVKKLVKQLDSGRHYLPMPFDNIYLTQREMDCLLGLLEGKSAKQIGKHLRLSPRTIEFYINKIKIKFKCRTTLELIGQVTSIISNSKQLKSLTNF